MEVLRLSLSGVQLSRPYSGRCSRKNRGPPDASLVTVFRPPRMTEVLVTGSQRLVAENPVRNWSENSTGEAGHEIHHRTGVPAHVHGSVRQIVVLERPAQS